MRVALVVEYEGTRYHGFQYQTNAPSIQAELEGAIAKLTGVKTRLKGAGRTDAGVHAEGQVVAFDTNAGHSLQTIVAAVNSRLPDDIAVRTAHRVSGEFDPRRQAVSRTYQYTVYVGPTASPLNRRTAYHVRGPLDTRRMRSAARFFIGSHDFRGFAASMSVAYATTIREVFRAEVHQQGEKVHIEVEGNAFLPQQVRRMVGALLAVGRRVLAPADLKATVENGTGDSAAYVLPPHGLSLLKVTYTDGIIH